MAYLYETHLHTTSVSKCAITSGADYINAYMDKGYSGLIVTDHFFNGNCAIPRRLPWEEWVNCFCYGFEKAKEYGDKVGFDVFFGWEETFDSGDDYLVYGLDKSWLLAHPEVRNWTRGEQYRAVRKAGGCVIQAHPFRQRDYISRIVLSAGCVDAVEIVNGGHGDYSFDALAFRYAKKIGKPMISGSDIHEVGTVKYGETFGVYSKKRLNSIGDFVNMILNNEVADIKTGNGRLEFSGAENVSIPVEIRDENDRITGKSWKEFIF